VVRVSRAARNEDPLAVRSEGQSAPRLLHRERGDLLLGCEIDNVEGVAGITGVGEGEQLAVRTDLPAQDHVARRQLPARRGRLPSTHEHRVRAVLTRHGDLDTPPPVLYAKPVDRIPRTP